MPELVQALWGRDATWVDVTNRVRVILQSGIVAAANPYDLRDDPTRPPIDPVPGTTKHLKLTFTNGSFIRLIEGERISLERPNGGRLTATHGIEEERAKLAFAAERQKTAICYADFEIYTFFGGTDYTDTLVGTTEAINWGSVIAAAWLLRSGTGKFPDASESVGRALERTYVEMAKLKSGVNSLGNPSNKTHVPFITEKPWLSPKMVRAGWKNDVSYTENKDFADKIDRLTISLRSLRGAFDSSVAIQDYRTSGIQYRQAIEGCVQSYFPRQFQQYVLRENIPLELRDKVYNLKERLVIRLLQFADPDDSEKFTREAILLFDNATYLGRSGLPKLPPSEQTKELRSIYNYICDLLEWCERGEPIVKTTTKETTPELREGLNNSAKRLRELAETQRIGNSEAFRAVNERVYGTQPLQKHPERRETALRPNPDTPILKINDTRRLVMFRGNALQINSHADFEVFSMLIRANGAIVSYTELLKKLKPDAISEAVTIGKEAPQEIKDAASHIRVALRKNGSNYQIKAVRSIGYRLLSPDE
jgi:hypothetical protein